MKDEIKEILEETRRLIDNSEYKIHYHYCIHYEVEYLDKLLDYITNLQKENERLKENAIHNDKVVDKAKWNEMLYKSRIEKAINLISKKIRDVALYGDQYFDLNELLQILQGVGKDE